MPSVRMPPSQPSADLKGPLAVLILDDERFDRHRMARLCSGLPVKSSITNATTLNGFRDQLDDDAFSLILVDYHLPDGTGLQALDAVRCSVRNFNSATIMVTGQADTKVAEAALRAGCADYLTKDELTPQQFHRAVTNALHRAALSVQAETQSFARAEVAHVIEAFAARFANDIKPLVSRNLRQVRALRSGATPERISAVEQSCLELWETLIRQERLDGKELMDTTAIQPEQLAVPTPRKPPSPFARMQH